MERLQTSAGKNAAIEALPFEHPKLSAMAVNDFASRLERALQRSERAKLIEARSEPTD